MDTRVRFSVDSSELATAFQRIKFDAEEMGRMMIQDARKYSTSSKEVLSSIEDQIKALERRNKVGFEEGKSRIETRFQSGAIDKKRYGEEISGLKRGSDEEKLQTKLLREMIETIRHTSKEEIREDRKGVEERIRKSRTVDQLAPEGNAEKLLKETLQRGVLGEIGKSEREERGWGVGRNLAMGISGVTGADNEVKGVLSAVNSLGAAGAAGIGGAAGGVVGGLIGSVLGTVRRGLEAAERIESARSGMVGMTGKKMPDSWFNRIQGFADPYSMGLSYSDLLIGMTEYGSSNISTIQRGSSIGAMRAEKGFRVGRGALAGLAKTQRGTGEDVDITTNRLLSVISTMTGNEAASRAYLGEYLSILTEINTKQLQVLGSVDSGVNTKMIAALSREGGGFENPEVLRQVMGAVHTGLIQSQTPQMEALQYHTLSRIAPNASLWELRKMKEDPFSSDYFPQFLQNIISMSGSREESLFNVQSTFGLSGTMTERLVDLMKDVRSVKDIDLESLYNLRDEAKKATGDQARRSARYRGAFEKQGTKFFDLLEKEDMPTEFRPPGPTQDAAEARSKVTREDYTRSEADRVLLEARIVMLEKAIARHVKAIEGGESASENQQKFYERQLQQLEEINGTLNAMNKKQRPFDINGLKIPRSKNIWE